MKKNIDIRFINKDFESRVRLGMMSVLMVRDWVTFMELKAILQLTDGNLASHSVALENKNYIEVKKAFIGKKPETSFRITQSGRIAFQQHIHALGQLLDPE